MSVIMISEMALSLSWCTLTWVTQVVHSHLGDSAGVLSLGDPGGALSPG